MPFPKEYNFEYIGFPGFFVSYAKTNDFYFSGHAGGTLMILLQFIRSKKKPLKIIGYLTFTLTLFSLIALRMHYTNDIIIGLLIGFSLEKIIYKNRYILSLKFLQTLKFLKNQFYMITSKNKYLELSRVKIDFSEIRSRK